MARKYSTVAVVQVNFTNLKDSIIYFRLLSFDDKLFIPKDTAKLLNNKVPFSSKTSVFGGFYSIFLSKSGKKIQLCPENKDVISLNINGNKQDSIQTSDPKNCLFLQYQELERSFSGLDSNYAELEKKGNATHKLREALYKP